VSLLPFDHPVRKAEDFAMVDLLSGGRLDLGVGRGSISRHFQGFGVDPAESKPRYEESLEIIKRAWTESSCSFEGQFWTVDDIRVSPKPVQQPHPPIYRGTVSPESYEAAALAGDNVFLTPWLVGPHQEVKRRVDRYRELYVSSTLDRGREASVFMLFCNDDQRAAIREAKEVTGRYVRHITSFRKSKQLAHGARSDGSSVEDPQSGIFDQLEFMLSIEDHVEERAIVGTPAACIRRLEELGEELGGLDRVLTYFHAGARDIEAARRSMELFGKEVIPHFDQS
jgi:alkanesulfonate monooxygenase SsuD/methylene tetrahydromethanopterin reductase-like flavin-dependent oxidoreductase (luciferase family)